MLARTIALAARAGGPAALRGAAAARSATPVALLRSPRSPRARAFAAAAAGVLQLDESKQTLRDLTSRPGADSKVIAYFTARRVVAAPLNIRGGDAGERRKRGATRRGAVGLELASRVDACGSVP